MIKTNTIKNTIINLFPVILSLSTVAGVLVHDMHVDRAATLAIVLPTLAATALTADQFIGGHAHVHVERAEPGQTFRSGLPKTQPPRDDERKYVSNKKAHLGFGYDQGYVWPSV